MMEPTTKMEKFLHQAIRTARSEVYEETEALEEGADLKETIKSLRSILDDLLNSAEKFDEYEIEEESTGEEEDGISYRFKIGETIRVQGMTEMPVVSILKKFGYESIDDDCFGDSFRKYKGIEYGETATVLKRIPEEYSGNGNLYLIEHKGEKFILCETKMEKKEEGHKFEFELEEEVMFNEGIYADRERFKKLFGYPETEVFSNGYPPTKTVGKVVDRLYREETENEVYVLEILGEKYFVPYGGFSHL